MLSYKASGCQLIGATAAALLFVGLPAPASAASETPAAAETNEAKPSSESIEAKPTAITPAPTTPSVVEKADDKPAATERAEAPAKPAPPPPPTLIARINLTTQSMVVQANGKTIHAWPVSSGAPGYATPPGSFKPSWMARMWRSRQYDDAPMPYSVFFNGGIAVHGTMNPGSLGRAASHGCVRLSTSNAAAFFKLVNRHGMANTRIIVHGKQPFSSRMIANRSGGRQIRANDWVYSNSNGDYRSAPPNANRNIGQGYRNQQQIRRMTAVRTTSTYWSR